MAACRPWTASISLSPAGEIRAIIGPNGAGKTTFVSLICGRVGRSPARSSSTATTSPACRRIAASSRGIAYTFQITSVFANLTAFDNVALAGAAQRSTRRAVARQRARATAYAALERVGLADRSNADAGDLAYGHQRLLEVAMGLALKPKLLILDEPTQGLSDAEIDDFCALVREIAREATVLLIEHNMPVVMELADRITVMNAGRILAEGTPERSAPTTRCSTPISAATARC